MLGYYRPQERPQDKSNNKRLKLLIQNLENIVELLKEEVGEDDEEANVISLEQMMHKLEDEFEEPNYEEEE